jgi:hypothetical protein
MKPLYSKEQYENTKSNDLLPLECYQCGEQFYRLKNDIRRVGKKNKNGKNPPKTCKYCSHKCKDKSRTTKVTTICSHCGKQFQKHLNQFKRTKNHFCSRSCAATYNNTHKTHGTRVSKLEKWLAEELPKLYPQIDFVFNGKEAINSELDIYIPELKLGFELNGIFHYEPIFGNIKLEQIQNNDNRKFQACLEQGIEFCTIDVSSLKYFKPKSAIRYLEIIKNIIDTKI